MATERVCKRASEGAARAQRGGQSVGPSVGRSAELSARARTTDLERAGAGFTCTHPINGDRGDAVNQQQRLDVLILLLLASEQAVHVQLHAAHILARRCCGRGGSGAGRGGSAAAQLYNGGGGNLARGRG